MFRLLGRKSLQNICGQQRNSPMADPIFGSKYGPQNGVQNWITFSFFLLGLCLGPVLGSRFGPKSGASHRKILLLPADVLQADLQRTSMIVSVNTCFFSLCVPICFLYSICMTVLASNRVGGVGFLALAFLNVRCTRRTSFFPPLVIISFGGTSYTADA